MPEYPKGQPKITILHIKIPAGTQLDTHHHPVINAGVLLSGQLTVVAKDGQKLHLRAGDPIVELVNTAHYGINEGNTPAEIIVRQLLPTQLRPFLGRFSPTAALKRRKL